MWLWTAKTKWNKKDTTKLIFDIGTNLSIVYLVNA